MQGYSFQTDMRVVPMMGYDAILGMKWLEDISRLIFISKKCFTFEHNGEKLGSQGGKQINQIMLL